MMAPPVQMRPAEWAIVQTILKRYVPAKAVWAFGSRATRKAKPFSDLDIAIIGQQPLDWPTSSNLAEAFAQSDLPFKVDIVDWSTCSPGFKLIIERDKVVIQQEA